MLQVPITGAASGPLPHELVNLADDLANSFAKGLVFETMGKNTSNVALRNAGVGLQQSSAQAIADLSAQYGVDILPETGGAVGKVSSRIWNALTSKARTIVASAQSKPSLWLGAAGIYASYSVLYPWMNKDLVLALEQRDAYQEQAMALIAKMSPEDAARAYRDTKDRLDKLQAGTGLWMWAALGGAGLLGLWWFKRRQ